MFSRPPAYDAEAVVRAMNPRRSAFFIQIYRMIALLIKGDAPSRDGAKIDKYARFWEMCAIGPVLD